MANAGARHAVLSALAPSGSWRSLAYRSDAAQQPLLQKLGTALAQANGYLIKSCPAEIPSLPVERLQLMVSQIDAMTMALEIVRVPLQKFEQSLDDRQRALLSACVASEDVTPVCAKNPEPANLPATTTRRVSLPRRFKVAKGSLWTAPR